MRPYTPKIHTLPDTISTPEGFIGYVFKDVIVTNHKAEAKVTTVTDDNNGENKIIGDCNYHLCKKEKIEVQICPYCKKEFCSDHINPKVPMQPDFKDSKQFYEWKDGVNYHPCPDYYDYLRIQERYGIHQRNDVFDKEKKATYSNYQE